ncbi:MAG: hypothetical protein RLP09_07710 [Sandaracinaceae bacterium]|nr:hypothetical protein [Myxococcales bacterium]
MATARSAFTPGPSLRRSARGGWELTGRGGGTELGLGGGGTLLGRRARTALSPAGGGMETCST